ncbi:MAG TPA: hypothetical protein VJN62_06925 [Gemmatimonadales bacterium]|nr:hypothetical protein [Gemmatimonadales bacterium]
MIILSLGVLLALTPWQRGTNLLGRWVGDSHCVGAHPACHDEHVIYQVDSAGPHRFTIDGFRVAGLDTVDMGPLSCDQADREPAVACEIPNATWHFRVVQDHLEGTLMLSDGTVMRRVVASRPAPGQPRDPKRP